MKLKQYLHSQLAITFFPIFLGLFFITSVVFLVKIASLTSIITLDFFELFILFSYVIPQILFYTMPISFFLSLVITLAKLASESNFKEINYILVKSISFNIIISFIIACILYLFSDYIVSLFYGIVNIKLENLLIISDVLRAYIFSVVFAGSLSIMLNLFFAFKLIR